MAIRDRQITIKGDAARVASVQIYPQPDGALVLIVAGATTDSEGAQRGLKEAQIVCPPGPLQQLMADCLAALRKVNGLEDAAIALEPKVDAVRADASGEKAS